MTKAHTIGSDRRRCSHEELRTHLILVAQQERKTKGDKWALSVLAQAGNLGPELLCPVCHPEKTTIDPETDRRRFLLDA